MTFIPGQRWISTTEAQLGLGIITDLEGRQVKINFPAAGEERIYAIDNAPLSRIIYKEGDEITTQEDKKLQIKNYNEDQGLIVYTAVDADGALFKIKEVGLSSFIKMSTPEQRLLSGLLDRLSSFKLRISTLELMSRLQQSEVRGLLGSRTSLLPHQVYIASEVAKRYAPRVLLADEVGLGKTIEAGMILHYQLHTDRAKRILVVVPDSLIHQWLIEMMRRFNLYFSIVNSSSYELVPNEEDLEYEDEIELDFSECNPFEEQDLILCSLGFLMSDEKALNQALNSDWDILVVDEAHHLQCTEEAKSPEYSFIEKLSAKSKGLLLLTATPEQMGIESHFARLHLLDPSRFHDCELFKKEEQEYNKINQIIQKLTTDWDTLTFDEIKGELAPYLGAEVSADKEENMKLLLDRFGTGRVLFRNTRAAIQGFPERQIYSYPLTASLAEALDIKAINNLYPEEHVDANLWLTVDPRVEWLVNHLNSLNSYKVLVICAQAKTAIALDQHLRAKQRMRSSAFHEGLSIIERDRAAAYFSESEEEGGAQVLICSEIGSEGRNFQFAHHLVLFDLPMNPDLLEQRIGRLDRIGQRHDIKIHVPYLVNSPQEALFHWYNEGINLFRKSCSFGFSLFEAFAERLTALLHQGPFNLDEVNELIIDTKSYKEAMDQKMQAGRDQLLELNSCNLPKAEDLIANITEEERISELQSYMTHIFHEYGIDQEYHSEHAEILRPTAHMRVSHFPYLKEEGITVTYNRNKALSREDLEFLSWEHPMVYESMELILESELGNAVLSTISLKNIAPGTLFLESFYTLNCASPEGLQLHRFLPLIPFRIFMDIQGKNLSKILNYNQLNELCESVKGHLGNAIIKQIRPDLEKIIKSSNQAAELEKEEMILNAQKLMKTTLEEETTRLVALKKINANIRDEEIEFLKKQMEENLYYINKAELKLQALRVVINK